MDLPLLIRDVPDFPKKGIIFKDITPLLQDARAFQLVIDTMSSHYNDTRVDGIIAIESRGFLFGGALAYKTGIPLIPARKAGKLPYKTVSEAYNLEYGSASLELHADAIRGGQQVIIVDDLLATGGTVRAVANLVEKMGGVVAGIEFLVELTFLKGRKTLTGYPVHSQISY